MTETSNHPSSARRQLQIQKLLEAISNYSPSTDQVQAMSNAKHDMVKNIQTKFALSQVNLAYQFPFKSIPSTQSDDQDADDIPQICVLKAQNHQQISHSKSKQKKRRPLQETSANKSEVNLHSLKKASDHSRNKPKNPSFLTNIEQAFKSGLKCQTPKVIKKQIILTNKKQPAKENTKNPLKINDKESQLQTAPVTNIKAKLKIKKSNNYLNEPKRQIHLRTQNNVNFKHSSSYSNSKSSYPIYNQCQNDNDQDLFHHAATEQKYVIYEEPSEESMFFNSRNNHNIDQNTQFSYPKALFNVSDLKQKLRQTSKSSKKDFIKKHKRTATQGSVDIKIKLFTNSFQKNSCDKTQPHNKLPFTSNLFKKSENAISPGHIMNRTISSLSQHSLKKGIKLCGKTQDNGERSLSKGSVKHDPVIAKPSKKFTISKIGKGDTQQINIEKQKKGIVSTQSFAIKGYITKESQTINKNEKQNIEVNRASKINSIMTSLKQGYKVKGVNAKSQTGIKTTVCR